MPAFYDQLRGPFAERISFLPDKPEETVDSTLRALWFAAASAPRSAQFALEGELPELRMENVQVLERLISQRLSGVPLAHLTGRQRFMGMEMLAGPDALVPRKETELLAQAAIDLTRESTSNGKTVTTIDVCTGSGNIALSIAQHVPGAAVFAADLSESAVELARRNAEHLGLDRVRFSAGDLLEPFDTPEFLGGVSMLTCNPPYIASAKVARMSEEIAAHEPRLAFDGGALGIGILMRLIQQAPRFLVPGGWLAFEVGLGQGPALVKRLSGMPAYAAVTTSTDADGAIRVIMARC